MTESCPKRYHRGFSLVELLVVMVIMGLVMTSVYGLYIANQRTAYTQDEVVELQQNLRVAMDWVARDIRMSGFMVPKNQYPVDVAGNNSITLHTASPSGRFAVIRDDFTAPGAANTVKQVYIESAEMVDFFGAGDYNTVRIVRPPDHSQPLDLQFTLTEKLRTGPWIKLKGFTVAKEYKGGDVIVYSTGAHPQDITYQVASGSLTRSLNGATAEVVADNIVDIDFTYIYDNGSWVTSTSGTSRADIRAVAVRITGEADTLEGIKTRELNSVVSIRNR